MNHMLKSLHISLDFQLFLLISLAVLDLYPLAASSLVALIQMAMHSTVHHGPLLPLFLILRPL